MQLGPVPEEVLLAWQGVLSQWTNKIAHDTLLGRAVKHNQLAWLATRYREAARSNPYDSIARDGMKRVQRAATMLSFVAPEREEKSRKRHAGPLLLMAAVLSTVLSLWLTNYMLVHPAHARAAAPPSASP
jgi:hypothetical protein